MRFNAVLNNALVAFAGISGCNAAKPVKLGKLQWKPADDLNAAAASLNAAASQAQAAPLIAQNDKTAKYVVNGSAIPDVDFDIGESYAGLMPIGDSTDRQLYFWMFPTANEKGKDKITIWLNGGPYCSSLIGLLQENGPFLWPLGVKKPLPNNWSWRDLTNIIYVENPAGTGFSQGDVSVVTNEEELAADFLAFFKNLVDTFDLHGKEVYVTGESYAGYYVPAIADAMFKANDTQHFNVQGTLLYDAVIGSEVVQQIVPAVPFMDRFPDIFTVNKTLYDTYHSLHESCGYKDYIEKNLKFPPTGHAEPMPVPPDGCDYWEGIANYITSLNPCADVYHILGSCPQLTDPLNPDPRTGNTEPVWFQRPDVQKAINAPIGNWEFCGGGPLGENDSDPTSFGVYPRVIEQSKRTLFVNGNLDFLLIDTGALLAIQNMTWGGAQGFQVEPSDYYYVPSPDTAEKLYGFPESGSGVMGITHTERGLTWINQWGAGHQVPTFTPAAAYRHLEFLLGYVDSLTQ